VTVDQASWKTTPGRFVQSFFATAAVGGILASLPHGLAMVFISPIAIIVWMSGLLIVGWPCWSLLCAIGLRSRAAAIIQGAVLPAAIVFALKIDFSVIGTVPVPVMAAVHAVAGAVAAWVGWSIAYRREFPSDTAELFR
jgi:hypothetical protein